MDKEKKYKVYQEVGDYLIDISKLVFGGVILAGIMNIEDLDKIMLFSIGSGVVALCGIDGFYYKMIGNDKK